MSPVHCTVIGSHKFGRPCSVHVCLARITPFFVYTVHNISKQNDSFTLAGLILSLRKMSGIGSMEHIYSVGAQRRQGLRVM